MLTKQKALNTVKSVFGAFMVWGRLFIFYTSLLSHVFIFFHLLFGTPSSSTQNNLKNEELNKLKRQNKLIVKYLAEIQENQKMREKEQEAITSKLIETTKDFRDNSIKTHNDFVRLLQDNLKK